MQDFHMQTQNFSQARHPTKTHEINGTETPHTLDELIGALEALDHALSDMTPLYQELGELLTISTKDRFPTGEAPDGTTWAPKTQTTLDAYARRGDKASSRPLHGPSGLLSSQIYSDADPDGVEWGSVGSNLVYAAAMQFGMPKGYAGATRTGRPIPWGDVPARPFLGISDSDREGIIATVAEWLQRVVEAAK